VDTVDKLGLVATCKQRRPPACGIPPLQDRPQRTAGTKTPPRRAPPPGLSAKMRPARHAAEVRGSATSRPAAATAPRAPPAFGLACSLTRVCSPPAGPAHRSAASDGRSRHRRSRTAQISIPPGALPLRHPWCVRARVAPAATPDAAAKSSFPIINRKAGLCGTGIPGFYTFSTAVDGVVDKSGLMPAKNRSYAKGIMPCVPYYRRKTMDFPGLSAGAPCGKWPIAWIEWLHRSGTRHPHRTERFWLAERRTHSTLRSVARSPPGSRRTQAWA
jgi:hypothetical protein